jgi:nicotinamide mononucleotide transporter
MLEDLLQQFKATQPEEWVAFSFAILQVIFAYFNQPINFLFGAVSVCLYTFIFFEYSLLAESILNAYYFIVSIYGLVLWNNKQAVESRIRRANSKNWLITALIISSSFIAFLSIYYFKNAELGTSNYLDALVASFAFGGTFLLLKRNIETWVILNLSNVIAMPLQWSKGLYLTAVLTFILFSVAVAAWFRWRRKLSLSTDNKLKL